MPNYVDSEWRVQTRPSNDVPMLQWPDGRWCHAGNRYIRELFERGFSRRNRGGSLTTAAAHISHLLRFCWRLRIEPIQLNDNQFSAFLAELLDETKAGRSGEKARNASTVIAIGRNCIGLLLSVANHHGDPGFIGPDGRIRASKREPGFFFRADKSRARKACVHWDHPAFPQPDTKRRRGPVRTQAIQDLREAVAKASKTPHQKMRRYVLIKLLEITGGRRGEVAALTVNAVVQATRMDTPMLKMITLKTRGGRAKHRFVPISRSDAAFIAQYAEIHRRSVIRRKLKGKDHGVLLINGRTGQPIVPNTVTQEIRLLANAAAIGERISPHMFRHRFITKLFVALIEQHAIKNVEHFRRMLLDGETFKRIVAEYTGHSDLESLNHYIHLAFDEVGEFAKVYDLTRVGMTLDSFIGTMQSEVQLILDGESPKRSALRLLKFAEALKEDIQNGRTRSSVESDAEGQV